MAVEPGNEWFVTGAADRVRALFSTTMVVV